MLQISFSTQRFFLTQKSCVPEINTVPFRFTVGYFHVRHGSLCSPKNLLGGSQFLLSVTMVILDSSPIDAQLETSEEFPQYKNWGTHVRSMYSFFAHEFSTTLSSLLVAHNSTKHPVFTRLHINGRKKFFFDVTMMFLAFLLGMPTEKLQIVVCTQRLV